MRSRPRLRQGSLQGGKWSFGETCETKCLFIACVTVGCVGTKRLAEVRHAQRGSKLTHPPHRDLGLPHLSCECVGCGDDPSRRNIVRSLSTGLLAPGDSFFVPPSGKCACATPAKAWLSEGSSGLRRIACMSRSMASSVLPRQMNAHPLKSQAIA